MTIPIRVIQPPPDAPAGWDCVDLLREHGYIGNGFTPIERNPGDDTLSDAVADFVDDHAGPPPVDWQEAPEVTPPTATPSTPTEGRTIGEVLAETPKHDMPALVNTRRGQEIQTQLAEWKPANIGEWLANPAPERRWLLKNMIARGDLCGLAACGGSGKTYISLEIAISLACGRVLLPTFAPCGRHRVLLFLGEDGPEIIWARLRSIVEAFEFSESDQQALRENFTVFAGVSEPLTAITSRGEVVRTERYAWLRDTVAEFDPSFIVLDPRSRFDGCDENSAPMTTAFVVALQELIGSDRALLILHHTAKVYNGQTTSDAARGSTALRDGCRWFGSIAPLADKEAQSFDIEDASRVIRFELSKSNYAAPCGPRYFERRAGGVLHEINPKEVKQQALITALVDFIRKHGPVGLREMIQGRYDQYRSFKDSVEQGFKLPELRKAVETATREGRLVIRQDGKKQLLDMPYEA